jgi:hypothetical protein
MKLVVADASPIHYLVLVGAESARNQGVTLRPPQPSGRWFARKTFRSVGS